MFVATAVVSVLLAAAASVSCYFLVAIAFHIRADDARNLPTPLAMAVIAAAALALVVAFEAWRTRPQGVTAEVAA